MRTLLIGVVAATLAVAGCTRTVRIDTRGPIPVVDAPHHVGAGQLVKVVVADSVWGNQYEAVPALETIATINRSLVFGTTGLSTLSKFFAPASQRVAPQRDAGVPKEIPKVFVADSLANPREGGTIERLLAQLDTVDARVQRAAQLANARLLQIRNKAVTEPDLPAALAFALDTTTHVLIRQLAADTTNRRARTLLTSVAAGRRQLLAVDTLHEVVVRARRLARGIDVARAFVPTGRLGLSDSGDTWELFAKIAGDREQWAREVELRKALMDSVRARGAKPRRTAPEVPLETMLFGLNVAPLMKDPPAPHLARVREDLLTVRHNAEELAEALNRLPAWTASRNPEGEVVLRQAFAGPNELKLKVLRHPRYGTFTLESEGASGEADAGSENGSEGGKEEGSDSTEGDDANGSGSGGSGGAPLPRLAESEGETVATVRMDVLPRHIFHLGAGLVRSPLDTHTYSTTAQEVNGVSGVLLRQTEHTPTQLIPAALLSYTVLPLGGKTYDARVYNRWPSLETMGLSLQTGVSLRDPTEHVFLGVSTEPIPGLQVGWGYHHAYVDTTRFNPGDFVPDSEGPATEKRWRGAWGAWSVGVDATVFFETIGALFK